MITATEIYHLIQKEGFFERVFQADHDWDTLLDKRDEAEFDTRWTSSCEALRSIDSSESQLIADIRERAFKETFRLTQHPELAGYVSDDLGLIASAADHQFDSAFIQQLWNIYLKGSFPTTIND